MFIMRYIALFSLLLCAACFSKGKEGITVSSDKLIAEYVKEVGALEKDLTELEKEQNLIKTNIQKTTLEANLKNILKKHIFINAKYISQIRQALDYNKVKMHIREKYLADYGANLSQSDIDKDFDAFIQDQKVNKPEYPWRESGIRLNTNIFEEEEKK